MAVARDLREETGVDVDLTDVLAVDSVAELATLSRRKAGRDEAAAAPRPSPFPSAFDRPWPGGRDEERYDAPSRYFRDGRATRTDSARPGEPSLPYRLGFTLLSFVVGVAVPLCAVVPLLRLEKFLGARYGLIPKVYILIHRCGLPNIEAFVALWGASWSLEGHGDRLPGDGVLAFDRGWVPSLWWCYVFVVEYAVVGSLYYLTWTLACRANSVALKWLVVGKQRPGTFPIWTSATGFRSALFMNAVDCSLKQLWTALDHWHPSPLQALYLRAYGARVGKRVTFAGAIPIGLVEESGYDLVDIGDDVTFECHSILLPSRLETTTSVVHGHVRVMRGARLGFAAEVGEGVVVGENAVVGALARASKMCPPGAYYTSSGLVLRGDLPRDRYGDVVEPPGCCDTTLRVPRRRGGLGVFHASLPLLSWMLLVPAVSAAASAPFAFTLLRHGLSWRLLFHVVFSLCAPCWCVAGIVRFFKWFLDMPARGDERTLTPTFVAYAGLVQNWACLGQVLGEGFFLYSGAMRLWWRALGMDVSGKGVIISEMTASQGFADGVSVGDGAYLAARVALFVAAVDVDRGVARFPGVDVGAGAFVGPLGILMPGARLEDGAAVGSCGIVGPGGVVPRGKLAMGDQHDPPLRLAWKPRPVDACRGRDALWDVGSTLVLLLNNLALLALTVLPWCGLLTAGLTRAVGARWAPPAFADAAEATAKVAVHAPVVALLLEACAYAVRLGGLCVLSSVVTIFVIRPLVTCYHVLFKHLVLGRLQPGVVHPMRSLKHLQWCVATIAGRAPALPHAFRFLWEYSNAYLRCMGATLGRRFRLFPHPQWSVAGSSEADLVTYGDDVDLGVTLYAHDFSNMHLQFKPVTVGDRMHSIGAKTQILPGSELPDGTTILPNGFNLVFPGVIEGANKYWAGNPVRVVRPDDVPRAQRRRDIAMDDGDGDAEDSPLLFHL